MIPPGGEGEIKVTLRPKGQHKEITKNIIVISNDPEQPRFTLTMKGSLLIDVVAQPAAVAMHGLAPGKPGTETFSVRAAEGSTATVKSVRVEDPELFSVRPVDTEPGALATYEVRFAGRKEVGVSTTNVIVETTGEHTPELKVQVRVMVTFNLRYPKRIGLTRRGEGPIERTIQISTRRGGAPKIEKVEDPDGLLDIEVLEPKGPSTGIHVRVRDDAKGKLADGSKHKLYIHTDDEDEPRIEIEYLSTPPPKSQRMKLSAQ